MAMTILVVDDDRAVRESLARSLQYSGYGVETTEDGVEALAWLSGNHPDAVIMDVMMPRLDGLETTRMLRANGNDVPILILTARDAVGDRVDGLDVGAAGANVGIALLGNFLGGGVLIGFYYAYVNDDAGHRLRTR